MKNMILTAAALLVLAGSTASAATIPTGINNKPKTTTPTPTQPGPDTGSMPPGCKLSDPNGCGILD